jgi:transposase
MEAFDHEHERTFDYRSPANHVPADHPLRGIKSLADRALKELSKDFNKMYSPTGWPSVPPGKLIRALLLQVLYSIRSERMLLEELDYNLLFRWFTGLAADEEVWDQSTFSKARARLLDADIVWKFFCRIRQQADEQGLLSDEHFRVDGKLIEALASRNILSTEKRGPGKRGRADGES